MVELPGGGRGLNFGEDEYYLAFIGAPSTTTPWMLQYGGHHLAINLTMAGSRAAMTPSLPAAQPATFTFQGRDPGADGGDRIRAGRAAAPITSTRSIAIRPTTTERRLRPRNSALVVTFGAFMTSPTSVALVTLVTTEASAHRRDEYLQAARLGIEPDRVRIELGLTPGIAVADRLLEEIDRDRSGAISENEARAYAAAVRESVSLEVDGKPIDVE